MENEDKMGKVILDSHIKAVKKLTKGMLITTSHNDGYYLDSDLTNSVIKIKSIRKYKHKRTEWSENKEKYVYEIDVIVDMRSKGEFFYYGTNHYCQRNAKRYNKYYRSAILGAVTQELKYFGIDNREMNIVISKIQYTEI
jgi:hypothetical protein